MANHTIAAPTKSDPVALSHDIHEIAGRLAGVEDVLRRVVDDGGREMGNILHLMIDVVANANHRLCLTADRVNGLRKSDLEA